MEHYVPIKNNYTEIPRIINFSLQFQAEKYYKIDTPKLVIGSK
jgi:hypothetical protein